MPTRLYFRVSANDLSGTFPSGEQSAAAPGWTATGATTLRQMRVAVGASQTSLAGSTVNSTSAQNGFLGFFCSRPLNGAQTVGGGSMILNAAERQSNTNAVFWVNSLHVYVWRPSTGALVGTVRDAAGSSLGGTVPTASNSNQTTHITGITSSAVSASDGDVIICEVWSRHTQTMATSYTATWFYDGGTVTTTENTVITDHASFLELNENLSFKGLSVNVEAAFGASLGYAAQPGMGTRVRADFGAALGYLAQPSMSTGVLANVGAVLGQASGVEVSGGSGPTTHEVEAAFGAAFTVGADPAGTRYGTDAVFAAVSGLAASNGAIEVAPEVVRRHAGSNKRKRRRRAVEWRGESFVVYEDALPELFERLLKAAPVRKKRRKAKAWRAEHEKLRAQFAGDEKASEAIAVAAQRMLDDEDEDDIEMLFLA